MEIRVVFENTTKYFKLTLQYFNLRFIIFPKYFEIIIARFKFFLRINEHISSIEKSR